MKIYRALILSLLLGSLLFSCTKHEKQDDHLLIVVSLDGFRWDYPDRFDTPNLDKIEQIGVKAKSLIPSFPSITFPNHYTMATGLYPDHHGIVQNQFYDPQLKETYNEKGKRSTVEDGKFYGGEPIWVTAEKQGMKSATFFWVGSEADVQGIRPSYWKRYEHHLPYMQRIDTVLYWAQLPIEKRPKLIMWYLDEPDGKGHRYGPMSDSLRPLMTYLDSLVGVFYKRVKALPNADHIDVIITSDHGMCQLSPERRIDLDDFIDTSMLTVMDGYNPMMNLGVKPGFVDTVYNKLQSIEHLKAWKHGELPEYLHYGTNPRTHDISLVADSSWSVYWSWENMDKLGAHGYDPINTDVHAIFYAFGPSFKTNYAKASFQNIHLYPLMAHILQLQAAPTDGNFDSIKDVLK